MKLRNVDREIKEKYLGMSEDAASDWDDLIKVVNRNIKEYANIHRDFTNGVTTLTYSNDKKESIKNIIINATLSKFDRIVSDLKAIKQLYVDKAAPSTTTKDQMELSFIEKELAVMTNEELEEYYTENYLNTSISRLCVIERKKRKNNNSMQMSKVFDYESLTPTDHVTEKFDEKIKYYASIRQVASGSFVLPYESDEESEPTIKMIGWRSFFNEIENNAVRGKDIDVDYFIEYIM